MTEPVNPNETLSVRRLVSNLLCLGFIDPSGSRQCRWPGWPKNEALRGAAVSGGKDLGPLFVDLLGASVVDRLWSHEPDP